MGSGQGTLPQFFSNVFSKQFGQLVSALQASRHSYSSFPVVVIEALFISEVHESLLAHFRFVICDFEQGWGASSLSNVLGCQMEVI